MRTSRRYQLRLPPSMGAAVDAFAEDHGLAAGAAIRVLLRSGLEHTGRVDSPATLAALVAAEHAALMVAAVLPDGRRRMDELAPDAAAAAEERLAMFRDGER